MKFHSRYDSVHGVVCRFECPSLTEQHHKDDCDLNKIMDRYMKTGVLDVPSRNLQYGDFTNAADFREAQNMIVRAREAFESLPSKLRDRFGNDPARLMEFLDNPDNEAEARSLGLLSTVQEGAPAAGARVSRVSVPGATDEPGDKGESSLAEAKDNQQ